MESKALALLLEFKALALLRFWSPKALALGPIEFPQKSRFQK
ncbi:hypothetical protein BGP_6637 [Beggiatoa sp. PS]|nr:hypothetical protein BGP_6637 [Beggiatoa sp. PS]